jgi:hypothetical protein
LSPHRRDIAPDARSARPRRCRSHCSADHELHFHDEPFRQGQALSQVYTQPASKWDNLLSGGGFGPGAPDPKTGYNSIVTPSLNFRYDQGSRGRLILLSPPAELASSNAVARYR